MLKADYIALIAEHGNNFKPLEFEIQGEITNINAVHFKEVLKFRQWHGFSTLITSTWRKKGTGYHPLGLATDQILFRKWKKEPLTALHTWNLATTWGFAGVGLYFDWEYTDAQGKRHRAPGLHVDNGYNSNRPLRWICKEWEGKQHYYYQNVEDAMFYNVVRDELISLEKALKEW